MTALQDSFLYERFKLHLAKAAISRSIASIIFSDPEKENKLGDRLYQLYGLAIAATWAVLMWFFLLDFVGELFFEMGPLLTLSVAQGVVLLPLGLFIVLAFQFARSSPWKMSHPDISFIASLPIKTFRIVLWEIAAQLIPLSVVGFFVGFLFGVGFQSATGAAIDPFLFSFAGFVFISCAIVWAWVAGIARLTVDRGKNRVFLVAVCGVLVFLLVLIALLLVSNISLVNVALSPIMLCLSVGITCLGIAIVAKVSDHADVTKAIVDNSFYADMYGIRKMPLYDASGYSELKRRKRVAARGQIIHLPIGDGVGALISRSFMSHIRQFDGLPHVVSWGMIAAPMFTVLLLTSQAPVLWMVFIQVLLLMPKGVREITRVFRDDMRIKSVSDHVPFSTLKLLFYDSIPGILLCFLVSILAILLIMGSIESLPLALSIGILANFIFILCAGIDDLPLFSTGKTASYEVFVLIFVVGVLLVSLFEIPVILPLFMLVYGASIVGLLKYN